MQGAGKGKDEEGEGEGEGEAEELEAAGEEETEPEEKPKEQKPAVPKMKYEVVGTLQYPFHKKTEDILHVLDEASPDFMQDVLKCGFVVYDITKDDNEIPKALATLAGNYFIV